MPIPNAAAAMTAVASHPNTLSAPDNTNLPMIFLLDVMSIIITMTGTETTPLITALQNSALIGSSGEKVMAMPLNVAMTIVA